MHNLSILSDGRKKLTLFYSPSSLSFPHPYLVSLSTQSLFSYIKPYPTSNSPQSFSTWPPTQLQLFPRFPKASAALSFTPPKCNLSLDYPWNGNYLPTTPVLHSILRLPRAGQSGDRRGIFQIFSGVLGKSGDIYVKLPTWLMLSRFRSTKKKNSANSLLICQNRWLDSVHTKKVVTGGGSVQTDMSGTVCPITQEVFTSRTLR